MTVACICSLAAVGGLWCAGPIPLDAAQRIMAETQANQEAQHIPVELRSFLVSGQCGGPVKK